MRDLIYGKNTIDRVVSIEIKDNKVMLYRELEDGSIDVESRPHKWWLLFHKQLSPKFKRLEGDLHFKWLIEYDDQKKWREVRNNSKRKGYDMWTVGGAKDQAMVRQGYTYFKGMQVEDVSVLSFDIETTGLTFDKDSKVLLISNTMRKRGRIIKKLFAFDDFESQKDLLENWCKWVREQDPSIMVAHNAFGFDLPYMQHCAKQSGTSLRLGRDGTNANFFKHVSQFRKDGSQSYDYHNVMIHGREIIDTFFLAIKYDVMRNYPSYRLKEIIAYEGLEKQDRQHYDAGQIAKLHTDKEEWAKIKQYAIDDADDALALYDLMIPSFFYYTQSMPRPFQQIINTATGSQLNAFMVRAYLQQGHSLPQTSQVREYEGGISFGNPGIYKNVHKVDVASLYPSIMRQERVYDKAKDPKAILLQSVDYFTTERLKNKRLAKETGEAYYDGLQQAQKIVINSFYGFLGSTGLIFNSPENAALVTRKGREILRKGIDWAEGKGWEIVNADTDSFSYTTGKRQTQEQFMAQIEELNGLYPDLIKWEDDGTYKTFMVVKAKNYVLQKENGDVTIKGSGLKGTMKEPKMRDFMGEVIAVLLKNRKDHIFSIYQKYAYEILDIKDIEPWCFKKTVTKAVLTNTRTQEARIREAIEGENVSEGDKVYLFFKTPTELCLRERFEGEYDVGTLHGKLYNTLKAFENLLDMKMVPNYSLKCNSKLLKTEGKGGIINL